MEEPWELTKIPASAGKPFAPTTHKEADRVIVSCPKRVDVFALPENKCVESWSLDRGSCLSSSAEQNAASGSYFVSHEGGIVYQWDETASCHSDWLRHDVHDEVMAVHLFDDVSGDALLVMDSGNAVWMTQLSEGEFRPRRKHKRGASKVPYVWSAVWLSRYRRKRAVVISSDGNGQKLKLSILCVNAGESPYALSSRPVRVPDGSALVRCCLLPGTDPHLVLLFSNGQVVHFDLARESDDTLSLSSDSLLGCFACKCDSTKCCLAAVDSGHVAIVGPQERSDGEMEAAATLWNMKYSTKVASQPLKSVKDADSFYAVMVEGNLVVVAGQHVMVVPCQPQSNSLSGVVACRSSASPAVLCHDVSPIITLGQWTSQSALEQITPPPESDLRHKTLQECLDDKQSWSRDTIEQVLKSGRVSGSIVGTLVERLQAQRDYQLLAACLRHVPDLPEHQLVSILVAYTQCLNKTKPSKILYSQVYGYFDQALACPYNAIHLRDELRQVQVDMALKMIRLLYTKLQCGFALADECQKPLASAEVNQVVTWLSMMLDALATKLILDTEAKSLLKEVNTFVRQMLAVSFQLLRLSGPLNGVKQKSLAKSSKVHSSRYQIEVLHI